MERKNIANCSPIEFLKQTNRLKKAVEKWLDVTEFQAIRKRLPDLTGAITNDQRKTIIQDQAMKNLSLILDNALEKNPEQTLEVLALCCFVEPEDVNNHPISFYLQSIAEIIADEGVMSFFTSLSRLGQMSTSSLSKTSDLT